MTSISTSARGAGDCECNADVSASAGLALVRGRDRLGKRCGGESIRVQIRFGPGEQIASRRPQGTRAGDRPRDGRRFDGLVIASQPGQSLLIRRQRDGRVRQSPAAQ
jgi:hypothetical protein